MSAIAAGAGHVLYANMSLFEAMQSLRNSVGVTIAVVESKESMKLSGVLSVNTIIDAYHVAVEAVGDEERGIR